MRGCLLGYSDTAGATTLRVMQRFVVRRYICPWSSWSKGDSEVYAHHVDLTRSGEAVESMASRRESTVSLEGTAKDETTV
jgi:hypothetical protein